MLEDVLDGIGFGGLWRSSTFHSVNEHDRQCTALTDRLIEVISRLRQTPPVKQLTVAAHYCINSAVY